MTTQVGLFFLLGAVLFLGLVVLSIAFLGTAFIWFMVWRVSKHYRYHKTLRGFGELHRVRVNARGNGHER